jgi:cell wall-associated NlpC family hydrolase
MRAVVAVPVALIGFVAALVTGLTGIGIITPGQMCTSVSNPNLAPEAQNVNLDEEQRAFANVIITVGQRHGWPQRAQVIAVATALQKSSLRNVLPAHSGDPVGLFQERPSHRWGTAKQLIDPEFAAKTFYRKLIRVPGWDRLTLTRAVQAVQGSSTPRVFAKGEPLATDLVSAARAGTTTAQSPTHAAASSDDTSPCTSTAVPSAGPGIDTGTIRADVRPVITYAVKHLGDPYVWGAAGPNAFDCSGLTMAAYRTIGIRLPHRSALQVRYGHRVDWHTEPIQPGDLIFMRGSIPVQDYGHTGIAISATEWINAAHSGTPVRRGRIPFARVQAVQRLVTQ